MSPRRPILASCLIAVVFATGGLGIAGGRVLCIGAGGHVAVAGTGGHNDPNRHHCCGESESHPADDESTSPSSSDCTDWSLDAQHADRGAAACGDSHITDLVPIDLAMLAPIEFDSPLAIHPSSRADSPFAQTPRAHLAPLATTLLLI
jgi:hypothetical protein